MLLPLPWRLMMQVRFLFSATSLFYFWRRLQHWRFSALNNSSGFYCSSFCNSGYSAVFFSWSCVIGKSCYQNESLPVLVPVICQNCVAGWRVILAAAILTIIAVPLLHDECVSPSPDGYFFIHSLRLLLRGFSFRSKPAHIKNHRALQGELTGLSVWLSLWAAHPSSLIPHPWARLTH